MALKLALFVVASELSKQSRPSRSRAKTGSCDALRYNNSRLLYIVQQFFMEAPIEINALGRAGAPVLARPWPLAC